MRQDLIDLAQSAIWQGIGDHVDVFAPGADVRVDAPVWSGLAVRIVPEATDAPSEGIGYQQSVAGFSFRASDAPAVPLEAIVRYAGASYVIAEMAEVGGDRIIVTVTPA